MQNSRLCFKLRLPHRGQIAKYANRPPPVKRWPIVAGTLAATILGTGIIFRLVGGETKSQGNMYFRNDAQQLSTSFADLQGSKLRDRFNFINKVVEKCAPAVVYVEIRDTRKVDKGTENSLIVSNGSGFIVSDDGWILTNAHVVINKPNALVQVKLRDGQVYPATVENADMNIDLALIKIKPEGKLTALPLAKAGDVSVGEWVVALGSPLSLSHSATAGVVSCVNRNAEELGLRNYQMRYIQTDAPITFGNSGGPLVNLDGEVVGINNLRITAGISFAIPIEFVQKFLDQIHYINSHKMEAMQSSNTLGITTVPMNSEIIDNVASKFQIDTSEVKQGVLIWKVIKQSEGEKAGFIVGDVVTHVNGKVVNSSHDLYELMQTGKRNSLKIIRSGKELAIDVEA